MPINKNYGFNLSSPKVLLSIGVSLVGGGLWLSACNAPSEDATANNATTQVATPVPDDKGLTKPGVTYTLFVPNADANLSKRVIRDTRTPIATTYEQKAERALELLFKELEFLPAGTKLLAAPRKDKNGIVQLNFSKQFMGLDTAPETHVLLILDAVVRTLGAVESKKGAVDKPAKALIEVEGKGLREFNQFSMDMPWEATETLEVTPEKDSDGKTAENKVSDSAPVDNKTTDSQTVGNKTSDEKPEVGY